MACTSDWTSFFPITRRSRLSPEAYAWIFYRVAWRELPDILTVETIVDVRKGNEMDTGPEDQKQEEEISRIETLLKKDIYSPVEAAEILGMRERTINSAVYGGELKAHIVNHDIVSIDRPDLIAWLRTR